MSPISNLLVDDPKPSKGGMIILGGPGSPAMQTATRSGTRLHGYGVGYEILGSPLPNWNKKDWGIPRSMPPGIKVYMPKHTIPGYPNGFISNTEAAEQTQHIWFPQLQRFWEELNRRSDSKGCSVGACFHVFTTGGHLPVIYKHVQLAKEHFPNALHVGMYFLPTTERGLWKNLLKYPSFPDDVGIPLVVANNRYRSKIDSAIPAMLSTFIAGNRYVRNDQRALLEALSQMFSRHRLLGLAEASVRLPIIQFPIYTRIWHMLIGYHPGVANAQVIPSVAELITQVLQPKAKLIESPELDPKEVQFIGVGGLPAPRDRRTRRRELEQFESAVKGLVDEKMTALKQVFPEGAMAVWSSTVEVDSHYFAVIPAIRLYPIPGKAARDYIDEMLAEDSPHEANTKPKLLPPAFDRAFEAR